MAGEAYDTDGQRVQIGNFGLQQMGFFCRIWEIRMAGCKGIFRSL